MSLSEVATHFGVAPRHCKQRPSTSRRDRASGWQATSDDGSEGPRQWHDILTDALAREEAVSVRAAISSHLRRTPTRRSQETCVDRGVRATHPRCGVHEQLNRPATWRVPRWGTIRLIEGRHDPDRSLSSTTERMATSAGRVELGQAIDPLVRPSSSVPQRVAEMSSMQRDAWSRANGRRLGGVAMDTFAYSLLGVNADQRAPTPCFTYADSGCTARVAELRRQLGRADDATAHRMPALTRAI
jgi:hypothetical protein